ncbi:MAG TPA: hypothetical protein VLI06_09215 [Solimonas sp.]|nr:hypothetical protein [Solimonas sp.]
MNGLGRRLALTAVTAATVFAAACGGGGGGGGGGSEPVSVEGKAAKGIVRKADVTLIELAADSLDPAKGTVLGTGETDNSGNYKLSIKGYKGGAVLARIKGRASKATEVLCDYKAPGVTDNDCGPGVKFGQVVKVDDKFVLETLLPGLERGLNNRMNATALTSILSRRAGALLRNVDTAGAIRLAMSQVNQLAGGIDVVRTTPINLVGDVPAAASPDEVVYAALNAAVLSRIPDGSSGQDAISGAVDGLVAEFGTDGAIPKTQLRDLVEEAFNQLPEGSSDSAGTLTRLENMAEGTGDFMPPATDNGDGTAIGRARLFVGDIRNSVQRYQDLPNLDQNDFVTQLDSVAQVSDARASELFDSIGLALDRAGELFDAGSPGGQVNSTNSSGAQKTATVTITESGDNSTVRINGEVGDDTLDLTAVFPTDLEAATGATHNVTLAGNAQTTGTSGVVLTIKNGKGTINTRASSQPVEDEVGDVGGNIDRVVLDLDATLAQKGVTDPVTFEGIVGLTVLQCNSGNCSTPEAESVAALPTRVLLKGEVRNSKGSLVNGSIEVTIPEATARKFNFDQPYSASNSVIGTVVISTRAKLPDFPEGLLTIAVDAKGATDPAVGESDGIPFGRVTVSLSEGDKLVLRVSGETTAAKPDSIPSVLLENASGVKLILDNISEGSNSIEVSGVLRVDGKRAGVVQQTSSGLVRIVYDDGTFESLFF